MAGPVGSSGGDDPGPFGSGADRGWPSQPPTAPPEPSGVDEPATTFGSAPTDPELPRTLEAPIDPAPFFHDVSGAAPAGSPFGAPPGGGYAPPGATATAAPAVGHPGTPGYPVAPGYPPGAGYAPAPGYPPGPYGYGGYSPYGPYAYGGYAPPKNNGLAIAAMVLGIVGIAFCQIFAIPALIMGFIARKQIRESEGTQTGEAFAITGIVTGALATVLLVLIIALYAVMFGLMASSGF